MFKRIKDIFQGKVEYSTISRSSKWTTIRKKHLEDHPYCEICGGNKNIEVHHIIPFSINPKLELNSDNLITLCESKKNGVNCHLFFGHLGNYKSYNKDIKVDTKKWSKKILLRPNNKV